MNESCRADMSHSWTSHAIVQWHLTQVTHMNVCDSPHYTDSESYLTCGKSHTFMCVTLVKCPSRHRFRVVSHAGTHTWMCVSFHINGGDLTQITHMNVCDFPHYTDSESCLTRGSWVMSHVSCVTHAALIPESQCEYVCMRKLDTTVCCRVLQCVAVCCSVLQSVADFCRVLQCGAVCCSVWQCDAVWGSMMQCDAGWGNVGLCVAEWGSASQFVVVYCSVLQCVAAWCSLMQGVAVWGCVLQREAVCRSCSVLQCVAVCCSVLQCVTDWCTVNQAWAKACHTINASSSTSRATAYWNAPAFQYACARTRSGSELRHCVLTSHSTITNGSCHTHWVECVCAHAPW